MLKMKLVDSKLPKEKQEVITFEELLRSLMKKAEESDSLSPEEISKLKEKHGKDSPATMLQRKTRVNKERLLKMYPFLKGSDLNNR